MWQQMRELRFEGLTGDWRRRSGGIGQGKWGTGTIALPLGHSRCVLRRHTAEKLPSVCDALPSLRFRYMEPFMLNV